MATVSHTRQNGRFIEMNNNMRRKNGSGLKLF